MKKLVLSIYRILFCRPIARQINQLLFQCAAHGLGILNYKSNAQSGEEWLIHRYMKGKLLPQSVVFDVGANKGEYIELFLGGISDVDYYAFEPDPAAYEILKSRHEAYRAEKIAIENVAVSSAPGVLPFYQVDGLSASEHNSLHEGVLAGRKYLKIDVPAITLDDFAEKNEIKTIDFLKIDTEGHELAVLQGAKRLIASGGIKWIQFEFNEMNLFSRSTMKDFRSLLSGYTFYRLSPNGLILLPDLNLYQEVYAFQNIFCVKEASKL
jgi:FkbM family methyltransferase